MPGWGIVANLTPPELIAARRLRVIRKLLAVAALVLVLLCLLAYGYAFLQSQKASRALAAENGRTATCRPSRTGYSDITEIQAPSPRSRAAFPPARRRVGAPMVADLRGCLPPGMTIGHLSLLFNGPGCCRSRRRSARGTALDASGHPHIGTITLTGTAVHATDVAGYVDKLSASRESWTCSLRRPRPPAGSVQPQRVLHR